MYWFVCNCTEVGVGGCEGGRTSQLLCEWDYCLVAGDCGEEKTKSKDHQDGDRETWSMVNILEGYSWRQPLLLMIHINRKEQYVYS